MRVLWETNGSAERRANLEEDIAKTSEMHSDVVYAATLKGKLLLRKHIRTASLDTTNKDDKVYQTEGRSLYFGKAG